MSVNTKQPGVVSPVITLVFEQSASRGVEAATGETLMSSAPLMDSVRGTLELSVADYARLMEGLRHGNVRLSAIQIVRGKK